LKRFVTALNKLYAREPAFHQVDFHGAGFEWLDAGGAETNVLVFQRRARDPRDALVFVLNFSDLPRPNYRIGVPYPVIYRELLNSDTREYGGSGLTVPSGKIKAEEFSSHGFPFSLVLDLPPLNAIVLKPVPPVLG
jgi:1,4-alpha-glucan branching enzyme